MTAGSAAVVSTGSLDEKFVAWHNNLCEPVGSLTTLESGG